MLITIDMTGWTQDEKNFLQAGVEGLVFHAGITYEKMSARNGVIDILNPSADVSTILTKSKLKVWIAAELEKVRVANEAMQLENQAREKEFQINEFSNIMLANVDAKIDAIQNLADLKVALKKFVRYVVALRRM